MRRAALPRILFAGLVLAAGAAGPAAAAGPDVQKSEKTVAFKPEPQKIGLTVGDVTIESVEIKNWPDAADFAKAEKDPNDTKTMWVVFTYSNKGAVKYNCRYTVSVLDPEGGKPLAVDDAKRDLDKNQVGDTNRFGMKMKTRQYKLAKKMKLGFEIWK